MSKKIEFVIDWRMSGSARVSRDYSEVIEAALDRFADDHGIPEDASADDLTKEQVNALLLSLTDEWMVGGDNSEAVDMALPSIIDGDGTAEAEIDQFRILDQEKGAST